jgi:isocitrate dehydrogenase
MLDYMGWDSAAAAIREAVAATIGSGQMTADLAAQTDGVTPLSTTDYVHAIRGKL